MKKLFLVLGMITCIVAGTAACGKAESKEADRPAAFKDVDTKQIQQASEETFNAVAGIVQSGMQEQYASDANVTAALSSWEAAAKDIGSYKLDTENSTVSFSDDAATVTLHIKGTKHDATVLIAWNNELKFDSMTVNPKRSMGELMENAALNTVLGMGTVFLVLILISLIISCMPIIPVLQKKFSKKENDEDVKVSAVDHTIAQIIEKEESNQELSDDLALVAVITAAIAAYESEMGNEPVSTDGFVVRSIKRAKTNRWQRA